MAVPHVHLTLNLGSEWTSNLPETDILSGPSSVGN
jgi:hypothetical protein